MTRPPRDPRAAAFVRAFGEAIAEAALRELAAGATNTTTPVRGETSGAVVRERKETDETLPLAP